MRHNHSHYLDEFEENRPYICNKGLIFMQIIGGMFLFLLGMRVVVRRTPLLPIVVYRILREVYRR
ncbi:hypothetical protein LJC10_00895 [Selenomonadales bacterium OttesenSCG-928-I06]|nr:hypothetical protein [Selenomonadales bacterium OttesenSCG-928-I06]